jgi:lactoylglutathione lyase
MSLSLQSFAIFVNDVDRAALFYEETLGLPLLARGSFGLQFLEQPPHITVHPAAHDDAKALVGRDTGLTLRSDNLLDLCTSLADQGVKFLSEPTQQAFGIMAMIADPDGNVIALWEDNVSSESES